MEKTKGQFKAYSSKTKSALVDIGVGEQWIKVSDKVQPYMSKLTKGEVLISIFNDYIVFIQGLDTPKPVSSGKDNQSMERMSKLKNKINGRICALNNATQLVLAEGFTDAKGITKKVLIYADEFVKFIENESNEEVIPVEKV